MKITGVICVGIAIITTGFALVPLARHFRATGEASSMAQSGKNVYMALYRSRLDSGLTQPGQFQSSTECFSEILKDGDSKLMPRDLSAGIMPVCGTADAFTSGNNGWIVRALPAPDEKETTWLPFLVSRNLDISGLEGQVFVRSSPPSYNVTFQPPGKGLPGWGAWGVIITDGGSIFSTLNSKKGFPLPGHVDVSTGSSRQPLRYLTPDGRVENDH